MQTGLSGSASRSRSVKQGRESERTRVCGITRSWSKFGSALSAIFAAIFVLLTGNYTAIFLFATIPYLLSIANFLVDPAELDGIPEPPEVKKRLSLWHVLAATGSALKSVWRS